MSPTTHQYVDARLVTRLDREQRALYKIGRIWRQYEGDLDQAIRAITEAAVNAMGVERASMWRYDPTQRTIVCQDMYEATACRHSSGMTLSAEDYPAYFAAIETEEIVSAGDAVNDMRTHEFADSYLRHHGIGAMLDAPIRAGGTLVGVLCHEHVGGPRMFHDDEIHTSIYLANMVAAAIEYDRRLQSESEARLVLERLREADKKMEQVLRDELSIWRILFEQSRDGIVVLDQDASVVQMNPRYATMLGYTLEEGNQLHVWNWDCRYSKDEILSMLRSFDEKGHYFETQNRRKDGTIIDVDVSIIGTPYKGRKLYFSICRDITCRKQAETEFRRLATTDSLTGLANRRTFQDRLEFECEQARRHGTPLALLILDIDHFKDFNDSFGHQAGDEALQLFARILSETARKSDLVARYGGEEFAVMLTNTDLAAAREAAERYRAAIEAGPWPTRVITASIGMASWDERTSSYSELMKHADDALYRSKNAGRNRVTHAGDIAA